MTKRKTVTTAMRLRIWAAHNGVCHLCKLPIHAERGERWHVEHIVPLWNDGADKEANMAPAHIDCHAPKTKEEAKTRSKGNRQKARHIGAAPEARQKLKGAGFPKSEKPRRIDKSAIPPLPPRPFFVTTTTERTEK